VRDFHLHSSYSDGAFLPAMVDAADAAGLEGVGLADHCVVTEREAARDERARYGFTLDQTYERRRRAIEQARERADVEIYDAVEMNYEPRDEERIGEFLADAEFEYSLGSVHAVDGRSIQSASAFAGLSEAERDRVVDRYYENLVALVESELFDVAAHLDLTERTPPLRGRATEDHYRRAAEALADSRTVPEINAGRALRDAGIVHPSEPFLDALRERGVGVTVGTDAHRPGEIGDRAAFLERYLDDRGIDPVAPPGLDP